MYKVRAIPDADRQLSTWAELDERLGRDDLGHRVLA
ncbi:hypothetical protein HaLaN_01771 [Haematococcus lacustris]|uniref:Uncharacterized protein n=1 Tax=Haematococcus lacustris TaxID=44745 RepID=A0A699YA58_HAELA|nr:hypothetical protein HaLaN_01771 [Haematococcus lacustris]